MVPSLVDVVTNRSVPTGNHNVHQSDSVNIRNSPIDHIHWCHIPRWAYFARVQCRRIVESLSKPDDAWSIDHQLCQFFHKICAILYQPNFIANTQASNRIILERFANKRTSSPSCSYIHHRRSIESLVMPISHVHVVPEANAGFYLLHITSSVLKALAPLCGNVQPICHAFIIGFFNNGAITVLLLSLQGLEKKENRTTKLKVIK